MTGNDKNDTIAVWAITPNGVKIARKIASVMPTADVYLSTKLKTSYHEAIFFDNLSDWLAKQFNSYGGHIFIMATGIVVRSIASLICHKTIDPAVVVVDEFGQHAISLLSGHIGGANLLSQEVAASIGAKPVITTATDLHKLPAIDMLAKEAGLFIENPNAIKSVNAAFIRGKKITCHDPYGFICSKIPENFQLELKTAETFDSRAENTQGDVPGVFVDDRVVELPPDILILRPQSLAVGIGCNRNTPMEELQSSVYEVLDSYQLSADSLICLATIDIKKDELGLLAFSKDFEIPLRFFNKEELKQVKRIKTPSFIVEKHVGVKSVCEAAAILATEQGELIVPKQSTPNVTVAIARKSFILSALALEV